MTTVMTASWSMAFIMKLYTSSGAALPLISKKGESLRLWMRAVSWRYNGIGFSNSVLSSSNSSDNSLQTIFFRQSTRIFVKGQYALWADWSLKNKWRISCQDPFKINAGLLLLQPGHLGVRLRGRVHQDAGQWGLQLAGGAVLSRLCQLEVTTWSHGTCFSSSLWPTAYRLTEPCIQVWRN
jgi:hypothetical protein